MSVTRLPRVGTAVRARPVGRIGTNLLASEWTKLRSVRSTFWTLFAAVATTIGVSAIACGVYVARYSHLSVTDRVDFDPAAFSLIGGVLSQLAIAVLGVMVITSEYGSRMIRTTFAAVPQRLRVLAAKTTVFAVVTLAVTGAACFIAFFVGQAILSTKGAEVGLGAPGALRTVVGTALYLALLGLLALGIGTLIRKTAGAIIAVVGLIFVLPVLSALLPSSMDAVQKFLPSNAGQAIITRDGGGSATSLSPWVGLGVFCLYVALALGAAAFTLVRRDA
ncbi:MAG: type transport system permease protein [Baekduia sp.]|jgi:ABC-type transport system involved in multi-copper enzyme maturation permease subunit|nr:type transport system permease protein [Baekduia sp.]